ncbi:MAG: hypothetical protein QNJ77_11160 [Acidimicrobiia bacterium]|nr:hypothetical protein [Acidimicrobiia bacterium]
MKAHTPQTDWVDHLVATLFATVSVLGVVTVATALILFFPGSSNSAVLL